MTPDCVFCKSNEFVKVSKGPGRKIGALALDYRAVFAPLPDDFEHFYCTRCDHRVLDQATVLRFNAVEEAWLKVQNSRPPPEPPEPSPMSELNSKDWKEMYMRQKEQYAAVLETITDIATLVGADLQAKSGEDLVARVKDLIEQRDAFKVNRGHPLDSLVVCTGCGVDIDPALDNPCPHCALDASLREKKETH